MKSIFESLSLRLVLIFIALVLIGLVIWFVGPMMSFDTLRPLESVGMRVTVIVLLLTLTIFAFTANGLWSSLGMGLIGAVSLCILVWHAGPLLKFGSAVPLADETNRVIVICLISLAYLIWVALQIREAMRTDKDFLNQVLTFGDKSAPKEKLAEENLKEVKGIVSHAVTQLKRMRMSATGLARLFEGKRYLYELPWYMIIGNPGAGKTTALMNSGLKFVLPQQLSQSALRGKHGTDKCDWWFTNEAVMIDTAGRYANHAEGGSGAAHNEAEWKGFLHLLRQQRPRAPINGAIVTINVADLLNRPAPERATLAADLRARLEELRQDLGIRFPVYVMLTKMDLMPGFEAYFSTLTTEARNQVWGFTLPYEAETTGLGKTELRSRCAQELEALAYRLDAGVNVRLQEEFDTTRRHRLALLPQEFQALIEPLSQVIEDIFLASRYDGTQLFTTLRGVYFTSGAQSPDGLIVDQRSLWQRIRKALTGRTAESINADAARIASTGNRSYFLHDLLTRLVFSEAHLVRPNVRWELRFRVLRLLGHALVMVIFTWLFLGVLVSANNNEDYLELVHTKTQALTKNLQAHYAKPSDLNVPMILDAGLDLHNHPRLDVADPNTSWRYGLYVAPDLITTSVNTYAVLEDRLFLPFLMRRIEGVLEDAIENGDPEMTYSALRTYLLMHDKEQFKASDVKRWLLEDWEKSDNADVYGGHPSMVRHIQQMFNGSRVVQSPFIRNDDLILRARKFLDGKPSVNRVYERIKTSMLPKAPEPFTLISVLGPQLAGTFTRASDAPLDQGISGLFTYAGYHDLFKKQLPNHLRAAYEDDNWVMGRRDTSIKNAADLAQLYDPDGKLTTDIRRLYFNEYTQLWNEFLDDLHAPSGATRAFSLQTMRVFAAPDSPLIRLAKAVVKETTLSKSISTGGEKSIFEKASEEAEKKAQELALQVTGERAQARLERQLVDNNFAGLREIMTGEASGDVADANKGAKGSIDVANGLINAYYAQLVVADNALSAQSVPPPSTAANNLRVEAAKMPAPFRNVLSDLVIDGMQIVNVGIGEVLIAQAENNIGEFCRRALNGKYPFTKTDQDVDIDDFTRLFAAGGMIDDFFQKVLAPYVDINVTPWRYKQDSADMPPVVGPALSSFSQAIQIRDTFFREPSAKKMTWKADIRISEIDPAITDLTINLDGQTLRYAHGPVTPWNIIWPGPRGGSMAEISANPRIKSDSSALLMRGPWAVFRLFERGQISSTSTNSRTVVDFKFDARPATVEINAGTQPNPLTSDVLRGFKCPGRRT